jgi:hypothetical protein
MTDAADADSKAERQRSEVKGARYGIFYQVVNRQYLLKTRKKCAPAAVTNADVAFRVGSRKLT